MASEVTHWLERLRGGDDEALEQLVPLLYREIRQVARSRMRGERMGHTLGTTGLVHETYLRLLRQKRIAADDRTHFLGVAAATMRRVLVDYARSRQRKKRGGGIQPLPLDEFEPLLADEETSEMLALHEALQRLEKVNPRAARVVEYRFFAGLSLEETAALVERSRKTVQRDWQAARAWLRKEVASLDQSF